MNYPNVELLNKLIKEELESKEILKDGTFISEWQLLYDPTNKIISALIKQDKATGTMEIFRFKEQKYAP